MAISTELSNNLFEQFWLAGMRKMDKKKKGRPAFDKALKIHGKNDPQAFVLKLIDDIHLRLSINQPGFDKMHPSTYLNGERWEDEIVNDKPLAIQRMSTMEQLTNTDWAQHLVGKVNH